MSIVKKLGAFTGEEDGEGGIDKIKGSSLDADVSGVSDILTCNGDACADGVCLLGAECANNLGEGNCLAAIGWDVLIPDDVEGFGAFHSLLGGGNGVRSYALAETAKFVGVRLVPGWPKAGVVADLAVLHGFPSRGVEDGER